jgi:glycosyltransferase involved in cell wall biosynthesis
MTCTLTCSIIIPCRDEVDNVDPLVSRLPPVGAHTELIFVDGGSTDGTPQKIEDIIRTHPECDIRLLHQTTPGGKADAVFLGFDAAHGDVLVILDADMTVAPEDLPLFFQALVRGEGRFANGTRFLHPMETGAMRRANSLGNRAFTVVLSWLMGSRLTDTLCGTKAFFRSDWPAISAARSLFGGHDRWGDFDLLLGAARAGLTIVEVPVRYGARTAGESKMRPMRDGLALVRTCLAGVRALKLHPEKSRRG